MREEDVTTNPEEHTYDTENYDSASKYEYEYGPEFDEDSTAIPEFNGTGPFTPSTPGATIPVQNASEPTTDNTTQNQ